MVLRGRFKGISAFAHRSNVPLQVFSEETTPILGMGFLSIAGGLRFLVRLGNKMAGLKYKIE